MGRTEFEVNFYTFFFLLGFLILLKNNKWKIFYSLPIYLFGFFSYTGGQLVFYLFIIITLVYHYLASNKERIKPYLLYGLTISLVLISYIYLTFHNQTLLTRGSELFLPTNRIVSQEVDKKRLLSVPSDFNKLFVNKATVYSRDFLEKYLDAFSPVTLFLNGEFRAAFSLQEHGNFYIIESILMLLGISYLLSFKKKVAILLLFIILISPITSGLSQVEHSYSQRAGLMYPYMIIFIACGITFIFDAFSNKKYKYLVSVLLVGVYLVLFLNLIYLYFFRFPIYASDGWFFQDRILSKYIENSNKINNEGNIVVFSSEPKITFEEYLYFTNLYNAKTVKIINNSINKGEYSYGNVTFTNSCIAVKDNGNDVLIYDDLLDCPINKKGVLRITRFQDVLEKYLIKNDTLCSQYKLGRYVSTEAFKNFDLDSQNVQEFCRNWITKL